MLLTAQTVRVATDDELVSGMLVEHLKQHAKPPAGAVLVPGAYNKLPYLRWEGEGEPEDNPATADYPWFRQGRNRFSLLSTDPQAPNYYGNLLPESLNPPTWDTLRSLLQERFRRTKKWEVLPERQEGEETILRFRYLEPAKELFPGMVPGLQTGSILEIRFKPGHGIQWLRVRDYNPRSQHEGKGGMGRGFYDPVTPEQLKKQVNAIYKWATFSFS
jgi:hypothetical protein